MMRAAKQLPSASTVVEVAKMQGAVWAEVSTRLLRGLRALLESLLEAEVTRQVAADRYERSATRRGHRLRNVVVKLKRAHREACMAEAKRIFGAPSRTEAIRRFRAWRAKWVIEAERAVGVSSRISFTASTTSPSRGPCGQRSGQQNILARAFREIRRRSRPMGVFTNAESAERIMYGVTEHLNANWQEHPLREIQQNS